MRYQFVVAIGGLVAMVALMPERALSQTPKTAAATKSWTQPKTPWGVRICREHGRATTASALP